ncbi:hypothetical protein [Breoghania sp.]|nr:hypothetical protein [Breoghania sp.]MDJ0933355.1 hypothetical protein [Breoghania sp.]
MDLHGRLVARLLEVGTLEGGELTRILNDAGPEGDLRHEPARIPRANH